MFNLFQHCCQKNGNNVEATFDIVERTKFYNRIVRHCCVCGNKVECCFDKVERSFDIVAGVDGALDRGRTRANAGDGLKNLALL